MENKSNIAIIDIDKYNALRDFKENILKGEFITVKNRYSYNEYYAFNTKDAVIAEFVRSNKELVEDNKKLIEKANTLSDIQDKAVKDAKMKLNYEFSRYSIWDFLKWRKRFRSNFSDWQTNK